ncbi:hypothetical protein BdWA1_001389 [Babesia duncani]|uniref:Uncharacterized protein n=1 Tax=Babesia duncani TaxID=323732 RepID=A0AAD9PPI9_9APIC|nr:hypothetical protein BdWA1_001389 [Babesia duncani]
MVASKRWEICNKEFQKLRRETSYIIDNAIEKEKERLFAEIDRNTSHRKAAIATVLGSKSTFTFYDFFPESKNQYRKKSL